MFTEMDVQHAVHGPQHVHIWSDKAGALYLLFFFNVSSITTMMILLTAPAGFLGVRVAAG